jgi:hypothetical protein
MSESGLWFSFGFIFIFKKRPSGAHWKIEFFHEAGGGQVKIMEGGSKNAPPPL